MSSRKSRIGRPVGVIRLNRRELKTLIRLADYYSPARPVRLLVRFTAPRDIRTRARFIADESKWLKAFARTTRDDMRKGGEDERDVEITLAGLIAFWGRLLASTRERRSTRKLSPNEFERREAMAARFEGELKRLLTQQRRDVDAMLATRRPVEQVWMRERLGLPHGEARDPPPD